MSTYFVAVNHPNGKLKDRSYSTHIEASDQEEAQKDAMQLVRDYFFNNADDYQVCIQFAEWYGEDFTPHHYEHGYGTRRCWVFVAKKAEAATARRYQVELSVFHTLEEIRARYKKETE